MSYEVLARKWRPRRFEELVGQEHVVRALSHALDNDRLHHAFLFTGTRGVGKTTIARILAKSLNCEQGVSAQPCGECATCREVDEGRFVDLIEVDAASRTKVDDTRELLDNVQYAPTRGRYKVYLIDEVHMLSGHSFNALLKTLEEPPPHVKFLLATTDPQKLPVTILSRCLQFSLKILSREQIDTQLHKVLDAEGLAYEPGATSLIAYAAAGSMRDALSLMDQAIAFGGGKLLEEDVRSMLGTIDHGAVDRALSALVEGNGEALMDVVTDAAQKGADFTQLLDALLSRLHEIAIAQFDLVSGGATPQEQEALKSLANNMTPEAVQLYYQIGLHGKRDLPLAPDPRTGMEMALLRMLAFRPAASGEVLTDKAGGTVKTANVTPAVNKAPARSAEPVSAPESSPAAPAASAAPQKTIQQSEPALTATTPIGQNPEQNWASVVKQLPLTPLIRQICQNGVLLKQGDKDYLLSLDKSCEQMCTKEREQELKKALEGYIGTTISLNVRFGEIEGETPAMKKAREEAQRQMQAESAIENDPNIQALKESFGAEIKPDSVRARD